MLKYQIIPVTSFQQNCTLLRCESTGKGAVVDPGGDVDILWQAIQQQNITVECLLITHGHIDHAGGAKALAKKLAVPVYGPHQDDAFLLDASLGQAGAFGLSAGSSFIPQRWFADGDEISFGNIRLKVIHAPGHTPGHVVYFHPESKLALVGDVLFAGSIGRTDFPRGDYDTLIHTIRDKLFPLGDDISFIPGHGPMSNFGAEKSHNPFVGDRLFL